MMQWQRVRGIVSGAGLAMVACLCLPGPAHAEPLAAPGDIQLRQDLQLLNDAGLINVPLTSWPISLGDVHSALAGVDAYTVNGAAQRALERVRFRLGWELDEDTFDVVFGLSGSNEPRVIRTFEDTPRTQGEGFARLAWMGDRFAFNLAGRYVADPIDGDDFRPDGTYVGVALGNWMLTAGWQERWYGPGRDGSLILSSNARPAPGIMLQRNNSTPFKTKWLSWIGPWSLTTFMSQLDDDRVVNDALLFGVRGSFKPHPSLEIGITRTAQWCGDGRPCDLSTFVDLLLGNDNRGDNVSAEDEPGNQLGGVDLRWRLPAGIPLAFYFQWVGEDGAPGNRVLGNWIRQVGFEHWGGIGESDYRVHLEVTDTAANQTGYGLRDEPKPNYAYEHYLYQTGYRYKQRVLGYGTDNDSLTYSMGATLVQSAGQTWNATLRYMEINRVGTPSTRHTLTPTPLDIVDLQVSYDRDTSYGRFYIGVAYSDREDGTTGNTSSDVSGFIQWSSR